MEPTVIQHRPPTSSHWHTSGASRVLSYIGAMFECFDARVHINLRVPRQNDLRYDLPGRSLGHCTHLCFGSSDISRKILFYFKFYLQVSR